MVTDSFVLNHLREWIKRESGEPSAWHDELSFAMAAEWDATPEDEREGLTWPMVLRTVTDRASGAIKSDGPAYAEGQSFRMNGGRPESV